MKIKLFACFQPAKHDDMDIYKPLHSISSSSSSSSSASSGRGAPQWCTTVTNDNRRVRFVEEEAKKEHETNGQVDLNQVVESLRQQLQRERKFYKAQQFNYERMLAKTAYQNFRLRQRVKAMADGNERLGQHLQKTQTDAHQLRSQVRMLKRNYRFQCVQQSHDSAIDNLSINVRHIQL